MTSLDETAIGRGIPPDIQACIENFATFDAIESTNSYMLQVPVPGPGKMNIAATTNQTAGRGRQGKTWSSPAGSGLCMSLAYTFASHVRDLPALTLALGLAAHKALQDLGGRGVQLKWPNDLMSGDGKLAGILTEVQEQSLDGATIVAGIGVNVDLGEDFLAASEKEWDRCAIDMKSVCDVLPSFNAIVVGLVTQFFTAFRDYEASGFAPLAVHWSKYDWLSGRTIQVQTANSNVTGIALGVAKDGALLLQTEDDGEQRIRSGTIASVDAPVAAP